MHTPNSNRLTQCWWCNKIAPVNKMIQADEDTYICQMCHSITIKNTIHDMALMAAGMTKQHVHGGV